MNEAVFISDLHLHPQMPAIYQRFCLFIEWAAQHTKSVYILGDFLHVWPGDDAIDAWSEEIITRLAWLSSQGVSVYFMPGNRDFLLGPVFMNKAKLISLEEPAIILLGNERVLLVHGDRYCTNDWAHQWLRKLTRNRWFSTFFLRLPYSFRAAIVNQVRQHSNYNTRKPTTAMDIVVPAMLHDMHCFSAGTMIHGHTHKPGLTVHSDKTGDIHRYVLSDWDENPMILCYNKAKYFFSNIFGENNCGQ